jgi:hypothetical protein
VLDILALGFADNTIKDHSTLEEILDLELPTDQNTWRIERKDSVLGQPVFRIMSPQGPINTIQSSSSYDWQSSDLSYCAGLELKISVHDTRREALVKADGKFPLGLSPGLRCRSARLVKMMAIQFSSE